MSELYQDTLREIVVQFGRSVCDDPGRLKGLLNDHLGQHPGAHQGRINILLLALAEQVGLRCVATGNVHYAKPEEFRLQHVVTCIRQPDRCGQALRGPHPRREMVSHSLASCSGRRHRHCDAVRCARWLWGDFSAVSAAS